MAGHRASSGAAAPACITQAQESTGVDLTCESGPVLHVRQLQHVTTCMSTCQADRLRKQEASLEAIVICNTNAQLNRCRSYLICRRLRRLLRMASGRQHGHELQARVSNLCMHAQCY